MPYVVKRLFLSTVLLAAIPLVAAPLPGRTGAAFNLRAPERYHYNLLVNSLGGCQVNLWRRRGTSMDLVARLPLPDAPAFALYQWRLPRFGSECDNACLPAWQPSTDTPTIDPEIFRSGDLAILEYTWCLFWSSTDNQPPQPGEALSTPRVSEIGSLDSTEVLVTRINFPAAPSTGKRRSVGPTIEEP